MNRRVVIVGVGVVTPIGIGKQDFWESVINGRSNITEIADPDVNGLKTTKGCIVSDNDLFPHLKYADVEFYDRGGQLALVASRLAIQDAGILCENIPAGQMGVAMGTTMGESRSLEGMTRKLFAGDLQNSDTAKLFRLCAPFNLSTSIAHEFNCQGPLLILPAACAAGNYALIQGYEAIRSGGCDIVLAGGAEPYSKIMHMGFAKMKIMARECVRPFDRHRQGLLVGEGAAVVILEEYERARSRSAHVYAELSGYGLSCDGHHATAPEAEGRGTAQALNDALISAKLNPGDIQYISAHGTGTRANDLTETLAIKKVFGHAASHTPISSIKSMIGHTMGAAAAIEGALCALALQHNVVPPTINYRDPDPLCDLDYVPNVARDLQLQRIVSNSYGFYGNNASIVLSAV